MGVHNNLHAYYMHKLSNSVALAPDRPYNIVVDHSVTLQLRHATSYRAPARMSYNTGPMVLEISKTFV